MHELHQKPYWHSLLDNYLSLIKKGDVEKN